MNQSEGLRQQPTNPETVRELIQTQFPEVIEERPEIAARMQRLWNRADRVFGEGSWECDLIQSTSRVSTVLHQRNEREEKRGRKSSGEPYIHHPLDIAMSLLGESPYPDIPSQYLSRAYNVEMVTAALLHDVVEDVSYGGVSKHGWLPVLEHHTDQYEVNSSGIGRRITRMVEALTDYGKIDEMPEEVHEALMSSEIVRSRAEGLSALPGAQTDIQTHKEACVKGMGALVRIFKVADLSEDAQERMQLLTSCLTIKAHDVLNNLGDGMMTGFKIARALELAAMMRYMGSDASTALLIRLSPVFDLSDPDTGLQHASDSTVVTQLQTILAQGEKFVLTDGERRIEASEPAHVELPVLTHAEVEPTGPDVNFGIQLRFAVDGGAEALAKNERLFVRRGVGKQLPASRIDVPIHTTLRALGRDTSYHKLPNGMVAKITDQQPTLCDLLTHGSAQQNPLLVPEAALLNPIAMERVHLEGPRPRTIGEIIDALEIMSPLPNSTNAGKQIVTLPGSSCADGYAHTALA